MKKIILLGNLLFVFLIYPAVAEQIWQGNAAVIRQGGFETSGLFAASNSFPKNTRIEVTNLENGKVVTVTVLRRIDGDSNIFLLLSNDAATKLGMGYSDVIRVKTKIMAGYGTDIAGLPGDYPYNPDEDVNPAAGAPEEYETEGGTEISGTPENGGYQPETEIVTTKTNGTEETKTTPKEVVPKSEEDAISGRNPHKEVFTTPYEDTSITVHEKAAVEKKDSNLSGKDIALKEAVVGEEEKPTTNAITKPKKEKEEVTAVLAEADLPLQKDEATAYDINKPSPAKEEVTATLPTATPEDIEEGRVEEIAKVTPEKAGVVTGELQTPDVEQKERPTVEEMADAKPAKEELIFSDLKTPDVEKKERPDIEEVNKIKAPPETELALIPTDPRPPKEKTSGTTTEIIPEERVEVETSTVLSKNQYYLQIGAYKKKEIAERIAKSYTSYPMNIVATKSERDTMYKVLIGPLKKDESGAVLYWFKAKGYKDAFLKYIKE
jgi:rare lipoprotein A (peptidoglycan hydrolase)/cell division protein FtsN